MPFPQPDRLVRFFDDLNGSGAKNVEMSVPELEDLRAHSDVFEQVSAIWPVSTALTGGERAERIKMLGTSPSYFNEEFVRTFSPQKDMIGTRLRDRTGAGFEIVGVVGDVRNKSLDVASRPRVYASIFQICRPSFAVFLRMRANVRTIKETLIQTIQSIDPELPVYGVGTMEELVSASIARRRFSLFLMSSFAGLALLLATLGIYGLMAFLVNRRVQEFSIRMALGAQARDIIMLALRPGLVLISVGSLVGLAVSIAVTRLMSGLLFGVSASDPVTFAIVPLVLGIVALAACFIPARYASRISPAETLRS